MISSYVKTKEGRQAIKAYTTDEMKLPILNFKEQQKNHKITKFATKYICLDTETSHTTNECGWVYQWAAKLGGLYVYGRRPSEIIDFMQKCAEHYGLSNSKKIILYIHNASYDLQYLKLVLRQYDPTAEFLAVDNHSIIQVDVIGYRIICSYKLTNMSLAALAENYAEKYDKAVGEIDYNVVRYQDQELGASDWFYMFSDVAAQDDGIKGYLKMQGYKYAYKAPITSTGFVRANCRKAAKADDYWREEFIKGRLNLEQYNLCRQCFMGGVCIASFMYSGVTIRGDHLKHLDFTSSYPARQYLDYMPTGAPSWYGQVETEEELDDLCANYCCIFILTLSGDVHIKKGVTAPCIPSSKCIHLEGELKLNGKVVHADTLTMAVCELDYKWIKRQYDFEEMEVDNMLIFERGTMPDWLKKEVFTYFKYKCTLADGDILRAKSKNMLNSIYGMTATAILRDIFKMDDDYILHKKDQDKEDKIKALNKYYKSYNNFMPYQYAIYTTAFARDALYQMIEMTGDNDGTEDDLTDVYKNFLYCDTDSVFYIETPNNTVRMSDYIEKCRDRAKNAGAYAGDKFLGLPTEEPKIRAFRALHSKCYAMEEWNKKTGQFELNVVIAGIPKKSVKWIDGKPVEKTNAQELGNIDNLNDDFTFKHCGGTRCVYNERPIEHIYINGHLTEIASSAVIENIEKEISDTMYTNGKDYSCLNIVQTA